jgi:hypothetical protein
MNLIKERLPDYFTIAGPENSHYKHHTNTFDFFSNSSDKLLVTIGDSWTWGSDITESDHEDTRTARVYGRLTADSMHADWLNLALPGIGNFWIAERAEEFSRIISDLNYQQIYVICTLTEVGRSFDSHHDRYIDYATWFSNNSHEDFLLFLNQECIHRIINALQSKVTLRIGTNFVDPCGFIDSDIFLKKSWISCIVGEIHHSCYVATHGIEHLSKAKQFFQKSEDFLLWMTGLIDLAQKRVSVLADRCQFRKNHPLSQGHEVWADYLLQTL